MKESKTFDVNGYWTPAEWCMCKLCDSCTRNGTPGLCAYRLMVGDNRICASCRDWQCTSREK